MDKEKTAPAFHLADRARAVRFAPHRLNLEGLAAEEARSYQIIRRILGTMGSYATNRPS